jgi:hypothetical protein
MSEDINSPFYLQHFLTGKLICRKNKNKDVSQLHIDDNINEIVPVYTTPALMNNDYILENEPFYLHFTRKFGCLHSQAPPGYRGHSKRILPGSAQQQIRVVDVKKEQERALQASQR